MEAEKKTAKAKRLGTAALIMLLAAIALLVFVYYSGTSLSFSSEVFRRVFDVNVFAWLIITPAALALCIAGKIVSKKARREGSEKAKGADVFCSIMIAVIVIAFVAYMVVISRFM
ncbi:MAG: hypothetical protein J5772_03285 [Clostridia bacterium]|nr:hypothetical protein [Clostridia bacterium]